MTPFSLLSNKFFGFAFQEDEEHDSGTESDDEHQAHFEHFGEVGKEEHFIRFFPFIFFKINGDRRRGERGRLQLSWI